MTEKEKNKVKNKVAKIVSLLPQKIEFIDCWTDELDNGQVTTCYEARFNGNVYVATAKLNPKETRSDIMAGSLAEIRCHIKIVKDEIQRIHSVRKTYAEDNYFLSELEKFLRHLKNFLRKREWQYLEEFDRLENQKKHLS